MKIDESSPEHTYLQLARLLRERIAAGEITSQLPSLTDLTEETRLAVGTVRRAIKVLIDEGLVRTVPGRGTYVTHPRESGTSPAGTPPSPGRRARPRQPGRSAGPTRPHGHVRH